MTNGVHDSVRRAHRTVDILLDGVVPDGWSDETLAGVFLRQVNHTSRRLPTNAGVRRRRWVHDVDCPSRPAVAWAPHPTPKLPHPTPKSGEMFRLEGHNIGDAWYYEAADAVHMYFLTKPEAGAVGWDIGHAATRDLVNWEFLGLALTRGAPGSWDDKSLATGSVSPPRPQILDGLHRPQDRRAAVRPACRHGRVRRPDAVGEAAQEPDQRGGPRVLRAGVHR